MEWKRIVSLIVVVILIATLLTSFIYAGPNYEYDYGDYEDDDGMLSTLRNIINKINDLPGVIANLVGIAIAALTETIALDFMKTLNNNIVNFFSLLENLLTDTNLDLSNNIVKTIFNILRPTASTFAVLFLIIQITKSAATFEAIDITRTMKYLLFFVLAIFMIDNSLNILSLIIRGFGDLTGKVLGIGYGSFSEYISNADSFKASFSGEIHNPFDSMGAILLSIILSLLVYFMALSLYITLIIRNIEILIMASTSCLFASTLASDATADVFKSFIKTFVATVSSTLFMAIGFVLFASISNIQILDNDFSYVDTVIKMTAILAYCNKTPQTIRNILGYGSPTISALSAVKSLLPG